MSWFDGLLWPIMVAVAWIMVQFHTLLTRLGLDPAGGAAWSLAIVALVVVIRIALIPLFVRQIRASRGMQILAPEMQAIQKKYKGKSDPASREALSRETMELYRKHGTNPFSSCLPALLQSPIFFALFRVLNSLPQLSGGVYPNADNPRERIGPLTQQLAEQAQQATLFGAPLSGTFMSSSNTNIRIVTILLIVAMTLTTFTTQRQLTMKNLPPSALEGPMAQQQKVLLYAMPLIFAFSGVNFPIGVLIYWTTTNLWSMGQQFVVIRRMPTPGSAAEAALKARRARQGRGEQQAGAAGAPLVLEEERPRGQREQPKRKDRQRTGPAGGAPVAKRTGGATERSGTDGGAGSGSARQAAAGKRPAGPAGTRSAGAAGAGGAAKSSPGQPSSGTPGGKPGAARGAGTSSSGSRTTGKGRGGERRPVAPAHRPAGAVGKDSSAVQSPPTANPEEARHEPGRSARQQGGADRGGAAAPRDAVADGSSRPAGDATDAGRGSDLPETRPAE